MKLFALVFLGLCATAMAGSKPWSSAAKSADSINNAFSDVFNAVKDIDMHTAINLNPTSTHDQLSALASAGRSLLERPENTNWHNAVDAIRQREQQLEAVGSRSRVLLGKPDLSPNIHDAVDSIRRREQQLEAVGSRSRVLLGKPDLSPNIHDAVDSIRRREQQLEAVGSRSRVLLQARGDHSSVDRMQKNTLKLSAAADTVAQAFSKMALTTRSRINASETRNSQAAANKAQAN